MSSQGPCPIAIVGIGCCLPGNVKNTESLWKLLVEGRNTWSPVPPERFNENAFYHPNPDNPGTTNHRGGHFISRDSIAAFDAPFFGISPVEASAIDPQQRILLETTVEALEDAGMPLESVRGSDTGVFTAMFTRDYDRNIYKDALDIPKYHTTGSGDAIIANRISYIFDFHGPSITVDTGCSGSLVALHQACRSLQSGESGMAIASGVNLILNPEQNIAMSNLHMLNDFGRSFSFDERGAGVSGPLSISFPSNTTEIDKLILGILQYGRGEGVVVILLKRLDDAINTGDRIRSVISNTAVNQDGKTNGITLPSGFAQKRLQRHVFNECGLDPHTIDYVEAHGTGTTAGDVAELNAIHEVFCGEGRVSDLYVGSIKSNIGHTESASGLAGLVKAVLILEKGVIPPNADFLLPKKELPLGEGKILIPSKLIAVTNSVRRVSVNSFGYGGTNAHAILESVPSMRSPMPSNNGVVPESDSSDRDYLTPECDLSTHSLMAPQLFVLTGKSRDPVQTAIQELGLWASKTSSARQHFENLAYTLSNRRSLMAWRSSFLASSHEELVTLLQSRAVTSSPVVKSSSSHQITFIFCGQGAQYAAMAKELVHTSSAFSASLRESDQILRELGASWSLIDELLREKSTSRINEGEIAQPTSTALQIALVDLLSSFDIIPKMVLGHSSGEVAAAYASGVLSRTEALKVSYHRSSMAKHCKTFLPRKGAMLAVGLGEEQILPILSRATSSQVTLACINSPSSTTLSGDEDAILEIQKILNDSGTFNRRLVTDIAYHSHHMQSVAGIYLSSMGLIQTLPSRGVQFISSVLAKEKTTDFGSEYWVENLVSPVRFSEALEFYCNARQEDEELSNDSSNLIFIELSPHSVLKGPIRQTITSKFGDSFKHLYFPSLLRGCDAASSILELVGNLFEQGCLVNVDAANSIFRKHQNPSFLPGLPTYPWDHSNEYWHESRLSKQYRQRKHPYHDLLGIKVVSSTSLEPVWTHIIGLERLPWLGDHVVDGLAIFPGSGYICMAIEAIRQHSQESHGTGDISTIILQDINISKALVVPHSPSKVELQLSLRAQKNSGQIWHEFRVSALSDGEIWHDHCQGFIRVEYTLDPLDSAVPLFMEIHSDANDQTVDSDSLYANMRSNGNLYGPCFSAVCQMKISGLEATSYIRIPDVESIMPANYMQPHVIHPTTLDAILHTTLPLFAGIYGPGSVMPVFIGKIVLHPGLDNKPGDELISHTILSPKGKMLASASLSVVNGNSSEPKRPLLEVSDFKIRGFGEKPPDMDLMNLQRNFGHQMRWAPDIEYVLAGHTSISLSEFLSHLHFKHSSLKILKANSGSRETTRSIISALATFPNGGIASFDFAYVSDKCFNDVQSALLDGAPVTQVKNVDPEIYSHSYDLIIFTIDDIDHVSKTTSQAQKFLKQSGWLLLSASTNLAQTKDDLESRLLQNSCDGVKLLINDDDQTNTSLCIAKPLTRHELPPIRLTVTDHTKDFTSELCMSLRKRGLDAVSEEWSTADEKSEVIRVVVDDGQNPFLVNPSAKQFKKLIDLVSGPKANVLWISTQTEISATTNPKKSLIVGFARSACAENVQLRFVTLDIQDKVDNQAGLTNAVEKILTTFVEQPSQSKLFEREYTYRDGVMLIPRLIPDSRINSWLARATGKSTESTVAYSDPNRPLKLDMGSLGQSLYFVDDDSCDGTLDASEVEITVKAHLLSQDVENGVFFNKSTNQTPPLRIQQFSGVVNRISQDAAKDLRVGHRVCGWSLDTKAYPSLLRTKLENILLLPEDVSFGTGSKIPFSFMTAHYCLVELARLEKDQFILVHNAAGDIGRAVLILAKKIGAVIVATVLKAEDKHQITQDFDLSSEHVLYEHATNLRNEISRLTNGSGVQVIIKLDMSDLNPDSATPLATFGTCIHVGRFENQSTNFGHRTFNTYRPGNNANFVSFDLDTLIRLRPEKVTNLLRRATESLHLSEKLLSSRDDTKVSPSNLRAGFRLLTSHKHTGNIILETDLYSRVRVLDKRVRTIRDHLQSLDANATYIIAGGLGDLGRRMCSLMARRGARYIVLLSRTRANPEIMKSLNDHIHQISPRCSVRSFVSDISSLQKVQETAIAIKDAGLPPVKGVVQSATVLNDHLLEKMTIENFQLALKAKLHGTAHLINVFEGPDLDFFVMLSSISGITGIIGQANYAAGNTYQDAVAQNRSSAKTHFISLDLGIIKDTSFYDGEEGAMRVQSLVRQGMILVGLDEVNATLDYALDPQARADNSKQVLVGIDGKSIADAANATPTTRSSLFVHLQSSRSEATKSKEAQDENSADQKLTITDALTISEARAIIKDSLVQRISSLTSLATDKIPLDLSLLEFGVDSLAAIELKNWIGKEFQSAIQASEILDEPTIPSLAIRIASRSSLLQSTCPGEMGVKSLPIPETSREVQIASADCSLENKRNSVSFQMLPVPDLASSLESYVSAVRMFLSESQLSRVMYAAQGLLEGPGVELQRRLMQSHADDELDNWVHARMYLRIRDPLHFYSKFYGSHPLSGTQHSQAERAAIISLSAWDFKNCLDTGDVDFDYINEEPVCMESLRWLFNANREPHNRLDQMRKYPDNDYFIVLRRGHVFKVKPAKHREAMKRTFSSILRLSQEQLPSIATLTADERDSWARLREVVKKTGQRNANSLKDIEASTFVICLDDESPSTASERCNQFIYGNPANRWSDKPLQFVVCENGVSGFLCEHTMLDLTSMVQVNQAIAKSIIQRTPELQSEEVGAGLMDNALEELLIDIGPEIASNIRRVGEEFTIFKEVHKPVTCHEVHLTQLSNTIFHAFKIASKAGCQLVIQLASLMHFGYLSPCWEATTTALFRHGRLDWIQVVSRSMFDFCAAMIDGHRPAAELQALLHEAASTHSATLARTGRGKGFLAHTRHLRELVREEDGEAVPAFFDDPTWPSMRNTSTARKLKTVPVRDMMTQEAGFLMTDPESLLVQYRAEEDQCYFGLTGTGEHPERFQTALERAADMVRDLLETCNSELVGGSARPIDVCLRFKVH